MWVRARCFTVASTARACSHLVASTIVPVRGAAAASTPRAATADAVQSCILLASPARKPKNGFLFLRSYGFLFFERKRCSHGSVAGESGGAARRCSTDQTHRCFACVRGTDARCTMISSQIATREKSLNERVGFRLTVQFTTATREGPTDQR
jgi:hypothetical protein